MSNKALILIDIQNDYFAGGDWPVAKMQKVGENAAQLLERFRQTGDAVIHIRHEALSDEAPFFRPNTVGAEIHDIVAPKNDEPVVVKHKANSFLNTSLGQELEERNITDVVICGAMSQMCIDATTRAAADLGFSVTLVEDACGAKELSFNGQDVSASQVHASFMAPLGMSYARVVSTVKFLENAI